MSLLDNIRMQLQNAGNIMGGAVNNPQRDQVFLNNYADELIKMADQNNLSYDGKNVNFTGSVNSFPTLDEAFNIYSREARRRGITPNYTIHEQVYNSAYKKYSDKMSDQLQGVIKMPGGAKALKTASVNQPDLVATYHKLGQSDSFISGMFQEDAPFGTPKTFTEKVGENPDFFKALGIGTGIATLAGGGYALAPDEAKQTKIKSNYRNTARTAFRNSGVKEAQELLKIADNPEDVKYAKDLLKEAKDKFAKDTQFSKTKGMRDLKYSRNIDKMLQSPMLKSNLVKGGLYGLAPMGVDMATSKLTGDERVGDYAEQGTRTAMSAAGVRNFYPLFQEYLEKKGGGALFNLVKKKGGTKLALSLLGKGAFGSVPGLGTLISGGLLMNDIRMLTNMMAEDLGYTTEPMTEEK